MRTVYCNDQEYGSSIMLPKTDNPREADVCVYVIDTKSSAKTIVDACYQCKNNPVNTFIFIPEGNVSDFGRKARDVMLQFTTNTFDNWNQLYNMFTGDIQEFASYSVHDFVFESVSNFGINVSSEVLTYMEGTIESMLRRFSVYTVACAFIGTLQSGTIIPAKFESVVRRYTEIYNKVSNANVVYRTTGSHFLSVISTANIGYRGDFSEMEGITMHTLLRPYYQSDDVDERAAIIVRMVREAKKNNG